MGRLRHCSKGTALTWRNEKGYLRPMRSAPPHSFPLLRVGLTALALGITGGLGFALWLSQGPAMLHALEESVAAWCF